MLRIPNRDTALWAREIVDECMASAGERQMVYVRAAQYYYSGSYDSRAAIHNKVKPFVDRLGGYLMQPQNVRYNMVFDSTEPDDVLNRAQVASEKLSSDYRERDADIVFAEAVVWSLINGCQLLKHQPADKGFRINPVHPQNFGVLSETTLGLEEQEAVCHVTFPTISQLASVLDDIDHPRRTEIIEKLLLEARQADRDEEQPTYLHQMVVGGLQPLGNIDGSPPEAAGIVNVFPVPTPWRPTRRVSRTVRFCELWIKDRNREGDWTTLQLVYPDLLIEGDNTRRNLSKIPGRTPFVKVQAQPTPGYFYGRSVIADVQMLQDLINKRLRDIKIMWDRNANAPMALSGYVGITEEIYNKALSEGGYINDANPNAKAQPLTQPPTPGYLEELEFIWKMFDESSGFTPIMGGQGDPNTRSGTQAQTLVRTSSPRIIDLAARVERQLAESGYLAFRLMQAMDPTVYTTEDQKTQFLLEQLPGDFQIVVDSHSGSPAFAEDNRQVAIALARAGAINAEDLLHLLHPPGVELLLANLRKTQKAQAQQAQQERQEDIMMQVAGLKPPGQSGGRGRKR